ncbi:hypothetical protein [Wolbachia endosymbiont of Tettigetta isshikii]|uniref:hypothetical protein n=1 Tax=Wolbachia endosymbiont of Tettigetta isshikii TaxID=3239093 RepID=UPI00397EEB6D
MKWRLFVEAAEKQKNKYQISINEQQIIVGVGNIYASESLFRARISPLRSAQDLTYRECEKLAAEIKIL